jgi:hypothetical protein
LEDTFVMVKGDTLLDGISCVHSIRTDFRFEYGTKVFFNRVHLPQNKGLQGESNSFQENSPPVKYSMYDVLQPVCPRGFLPGCW